MELRRIVEIVYYPMTESSVDLPDNATIVAVDLRDCGTPASRPAGVWVEVLIERYNEFGKDTHASDAAHGA